MSAVGGAFEGVCTYNGETIDRVSFGIGYDAKGNAICWRGPSGHGEWEDVPTRPEPMEKPPLNLEQDVYRWIDPWEGG